MPPNASCLLSGGSVATASGAMATGVDVDSQRATIEVAAAGSGASGGSAGACPSSMRRSTEATLVCQPRRAQPNRRQPRSPHSAPRAPGSTSSIGALVGQSSASQVLPAFVVSVACTSFGSP
ncbi:MAG: hypothetical protein ACHREM_26365 [Polyangiales bacterium]